MKMASEPFLLILEKLTSKKGYMTQPELILKLP